MTEYVCGFAFDTDAQNVALIRKARPAWQAGKLNGIGGHVEPGETASAAMGREFLEETGLYTPGWRRFLHLTDGQLRWCVTFYRAFDVPLDKVETRTDETVGVYCLDELPDMKVVPNLRWLIPLAADRHWLAGNSLLNMIDTSGVSG